MAAGGAAGGRLPLRAGRRGRRWEGAAGAEHAKAGVFKAARQVLAGPREARREEKRGIAAQRSDGDGEGGLGQSVSEGSIPVACCFTPARPLGTSLRAAPTHSRARLRLQFPRRSPLTRRPLVHSGRAFLPRGVRCAPSACFSRARAIAEHEKWSLARCRARAAAWARARGFSPRRGNGGSAALLPARLTSPALASRCVRERTMAAPSVEHHFDGDGRLLTATSDRRTEIRKALVALQQGLQRREGHPVHVTSTLRFNVLGPIPKEHVYTINVTDAAFNADQFAKTRTPAERLPGGSAASPVPANHVNGRRASVASSVRCNGDDESEGRPPKRARLDGDDRRTGSISDLSTAQRVDELTSFAKSWHSEWKGQDEENEDDEKHSEASLGAQLTAELNSEAQRAEADPRNSSTINID